MAVGCMAEMGEVQLGLGLGSPSDRQSCTLIHSYGQFTNITNQQNVVVFSAVRGRGIPGKKSTHEQQLQNPSNKPAAVFRPEASLL